MSDEGDFDWHAFRQVMNSASVERRANNRLRGAERLAAEGVRFESKNDGAHLIVQADSHKINYWPGTGLWKTQGYRFTLQGRGINSLLKHLVRELP